MNLFVCLFVLLLHSSLIVCKAAINTQSPSLCGPSIACSSRISLLRDSNRRRTLDGVLSLRGGDGIKKPKKKSTFKQIKELLDQVKPATRAYLLLCIFCTLVHVTGLPAPALFGLDISKLWQVWRPLTSMAYLGAPSMSMANSLYFLVTYGQRLESDNGTGAHAWFLLVQTLILSFFGLLLGFPFHAQAMISAAVYVSSHINPMQQMPFQFGFMITSWQLPYCMMIIDCLSQQNVGAAWPHVLGILSGHTYHFFTKLWPAVGGKDMLSPPKWFVNRMGGRPASNVAGVDFRNGKTKKKTIQRKSSSKAPKGAS